ncbi:autotransporter domain-containing protein [Burkholderia sp. WAC0059]|uniref:autotransporter domain-containing protein n=1 Tax=Burkholderia sp. WAC0059 TaxID=2066022 RepID=UPI0015E074F0|nr:autotransporter domain-containing protein [Burkholderia sp. WAC0059]
MSRVGVRSTGNRFAASALSLAIVTVFSPAHAQSTSSGIVESGGSPVTVPADTTITSGDGNGSSSGPGYAVEATSGANVTLQDDTVDQTYTGAKTYGIYANGTGTQVSASGTNVTVAGSDPADVPPTYSSGNAPIGADAESGGTVALSGGSVTMTGTDGGTIGVRAEIGGTLEAVDVAIATASALGYGAYAWADSSAGGIVELTGGSVATAGDEAHALYSQDSAGSGSPTPASLSANGVAVTTSGEGADAAKAYTGGVMALGASGSGSPTTLSTSGADAAGIESAGVDYVSLAPSSVTADDTTIDTYGSLAYGVFANDDGQVTLSNTRVHTHDTGTQDVGLFASSGEISGDNVSVVMDGSGTSGGNASYGVEASSTVQPYTGEDREPSGIAFSAGSVTLQNSSIVADGTERSYGVLASEGGSVTLHDTSVETTGNDSHAVLAWQLEGATDPALTLITIDAGSAVTTSGTNSYGLFGQYVGGEVEADDVSVNTSGDIGRGVYAWDGGVVDISNSTVKTTGDEAEGMMSASDEASQVPVIEASNVAVATTGTQSAGVSAGAADGTLAGTLDFTGGSIATSGADSAGALAQYVSTANLRDTTVTASGVGSAAAAVMSGGTLNVNGSTLTSTQSDGIAITDSGTVTLTDTTVKAAGASIVSDLESAGQTQNIEIGAGSNLTDNDGTLLQVNRSTAGMDGIVNLTLLAGAVASGNIVDTDGLDGSGNRAGGGTVNFTEDAGASWSGSTTAPLNDVSVADGASFDYTGSAPVTGNVQAGTSSQVSFSGPASVAGSVQAGENATVTFGDTAVIAGELASDDAKVSFAKGAVVGSLAGSGSVTLGAQGTLTLSNASGNYSGSIGGSGGLTLSGGRQTFSGLNTYTGATSVADGATLALTGAGRITASSGVTDNGVLDVSQTTGGTSIANLAGTGAVALGSQTLALSNASDTTFGGAFEGAGEIVKQGSGALVVDGDSASFAGTTEVAGGQLEIGDADTPTAALGGSVTVDTAGTLRGHGTVGGNVSNSGTVAPGGTIGTLTVDGNYAQAADATLAIEVSPTAASELMVNGSATLNGVLAITYDPGTYSAKQYTLLSAAQGISGTFSRIVNVGAANLGSLGPSVSYGPDSVDLALNVVAPTGTSIYTTLGTTAILGAQAESAALLDRLDAPSNAPAAPSGWITATGTQTTVGGTGDAPGFQSDRYGFLAGLQQQFGAYTAGVAAGYDHADIDESGTGDSGTTDTLRAALYGSRFVGPVDLGATFGAGLDFLSQKRPFGSAGTAEGDHMGQEFNVGGQASLPMTFGSVTVTPKLGLRYAYFHADAFGESGAGGEDLNVGTDNVRSLQPYVGVTVDRAFGNALKPVNVELRLGYAHELLDGNRAMSVASQDGTLFAAPGTSLPRGYLTLGGGITMHPVKNLDVSLDYDALVNTTHASAQEGSMRVGYRF